MLRFSRIIMIVALIILLPLGKRVPHAKFGSHGAFYRYRRLRGIAFSCDF